MGVLRAPTLRKTDDVDFVCFVFLHVSCMSPKTCISKHYWHVLQNISHGLLHMDSSDRSTTDRPSARPADRPAVRPPDRPTVCPTDRPTNRPCPPYRKNLSYMGPAFICPAYIYSSSRKIPLRRPETIVRAVDSNVLNVNAVSRVIIIYVL